MRTRMGQRRAATERDTVGSWLAGRRGWNCAEPNPSGAKAGAGGKGDKAAWARRGVWAALPWQPVAEQHGPQFTAKLVSLHSNFPYATKLPDGGAFTLTLINHLCSFSRHFTSHPHILSTQCRILVKVVDTISNHSTEVEAVATALHSRSRTEEEEVMGTYETCSYDR